jgi:hypothetical protein
MGIEESNIDLPVPQMPYDALCPHCAAEIFQDLSDTWYGSEDIDEGPNLTIASTYWLPLSHQLIGTPRKLPIKRTPYAFRELIPYSGIRFD